MKTIRTTQTLDERIRRYTEEAVRKQARYMSLRYQQDGRWTSKQAVNFQVAIGDLLDACYLDIAKQSVKDWEQTPTEQSYDKWIAKVKETLDKEA